MIRMVDWETVPVAPPRRARSWAALAGLIDGYVGENGVSGDAAWGDGPMSLAEMESEGWLDEEGDEPGSEDLVDLDRIFESCPA